MKTLDQIRPAITSLEAIPAIPAIVQPLASMLQLPVEQVNVEQVVQLVSYDSSIAAQCLRMANSPLFGRRKTETVRSAILTLGLKRVQAILLGCCLNRIVPAVNGLLMPPPSGATLWVVRRSAANWRL
jgi:HD-like signal output (HDOD) protein